MNNLGLKIIVGITVGVVFFFALPFVTLLSGCAAWIVGLFFGDTILGVLAKFGIHGISMWEIGVTLGFLGSFVKSSCTNSKE